MNYRCPSSPRKNTNKTFCLIHKIIKLIEENYILDSKDIIKSILNKININSMNELELSEFIYSILKKYDKHFSFTPLEIESSHDQHHINFIQTKIEPDIAIVKIKEFPDFQMTQQYRQKSFDDISKRRKTLLCNHIIQTFREIKDYPNILFDLRNNPGGDEMVAIFMLSFIFGKRTHVNTNVFHNHERRQYTLSRKELENICGCIDIPLLTNKNIFILINRNTFSAAELFAYILQTFGKGIVIGKENSGGGANGGEYFYINHKMKIFIPYYRVNNPLTKENWETKGVQPDILIQ
jgi:C-terminal processing protease CtpA/Prc